MQWRVEDTIIILDEGTPPQPQSGKCDMFVPGNEMCRREVEQKCFRIAANAAQVASGTDLRACDQVLEKVDTFKYLVRILSYDDIN